MKNAMRFLFIITVLVPVSLFGQQTLDSAFSRPANLSDKQADEANTFEHAGKKDRLIKEGCEKQGLGKCDPSDADPQGLKGALEQHIGKAYGAMGMLMGGGKPKITMKDKPPKADSKEVTEGKDAKKDKNEKADYCMYGALGYEIVAGMLQMSMQGKAEKESSKIKDHQLQPLVNLREAHKARAKTATYQSAMYGAVTACYIGYGAMGASTSDWKYWVKLGGATALTTLYVLKAKKHADAAKKVQKVIDGLPKSGDCNPWTGTSCFCREMSSKTLYPSQYQEVCVLNNGNFDTPKVAMGCGTMVNGKMQFDKECKCKASNTCFRMSVKLSDPNLNFGKNFMNQANKGFDLLNSGEYDQAKLNNYSTQTAALASKLKRPNVNAPAVALNAEQRQAAEVFRDFMPDSVAALAGASEPSNPPGGGGLMTSSTSSALNALPDNIRKELAEADVTYKSGSSKSSNVPEEEFVMPSLAANQEASNQGSVEVVSFADKAVKQAEVSNSPETPIFDIISNRYRKSGWDKLEHSKNLE